MPALLNSRWILSVSWSLATARWKASMAASSDTSATKVVTRVPCGASASQRLLVTAMLAAETSHIATLQPSAASWRANSRPMPVPPPVITANRPAKSFMEVLLVIGPRLLDRKASRGARGPHTMDHVGFSTAKAGAHSGWAGTAARFLAHIGLRDRV